LDGRAKIAKAVLIRALKHEVRSHFQCAAALQPAAKYFYFFFSEIVVIDADPASSKGRTRRHERGGGLRWTCRRRQTTAAGADGEIVWSWHPGADAKFAMPLDEHRG